eukprot:355607-Chlamydomonas_euryale.AAC.6
MCGMWNVEFRTGCDKLRAIELVRLLSLSVSLSLSGIVDPGPSQQHRSRAKASCRAVPGTRKSSLQRRAVAADWRGPAESPPADVWADGTAAHLPLTRAHRARRGHASGPLTSARRAALRRRQSLHNKEARASPAIWVPLAEGFVVLTNRERADPSFPSFTAGGLFGGGRGSHRHPLRLGLRPASRAGCELGRSSAAVARAPARRRRVAPASAAPVGPPRVPLVLGAPVAWLRGWLGSTAPSWTASGGESAATAATRLAL